MSSITQKVIDNYQTLIPQTDCFHQSLGAHEEMMLCWGLFKQAEKFDGIGSFKCRGCIMSKQEINNKGKNK